MTTMMQERGVVEKTRERDILGKRKSDYAVLRRIEELGGDVDDYHLRERGSWLTNDALRGRETHRFDFEEQVAARRREFTTGSEPFGVQLDNLGAVQTQVEETLYQRSRWQSWGIPVNTSINEGQDTAAYYVGDVTGSAALTDDYGTDSPTVRQSLSKRSYTLAYGTNRVLYSDQEIAVAANAGVSLPSETVSRAVDFCLKEMESLLLNGHDDSDLKGLLNQETVAANSKSTQPNRVITRAATRTWLVGNNATDPQNIANDIASQIGNVIEDSNGLLLDVGGELVIAVPGRVYNTITTYGVHQYSDQSIANYVRDHNPWSDVGNALTFVRMQELTDTAVMWINSPRVFEFGVSIMPRVKAPVRQAHHVEIPLEFKCSPGIALKQPGGIKHLTNVA